MCRLLYTCNEILSVTTMNPHGTTVQLLGLVPILGGIYANETSLVLASSKDAWHYTIHVCDPVWINGKSSGVDVTSYTYSNVLGVKKKHAFHSVASMHVYCIVNGSRCYGTRLYRVKHEKITHSIKHTLSLFPSLYVAPNISCSDIIRTERSRRVTWRADGEDILSHKQQHQLEFASSLLYTERFHHTCRALPQALHDNINVGSIDRMTTSSFLSSGSYAMARVADMLIVAPQNGDVTADHGGEVAINNVTIYFPCRGGSSDAHQRLTAMLQSLYNKKKQATNSIPVLSSPLFTCDICGDGAIVMHANEGELGFILCQPIPIMPCRESMCKQHLAGPLHLFSISLENASWLEREILCDQEDHTLEALSHRIMKALQPCM